MGDEEKLTIESLQADLAALVVLLTPKPVPPAVVPVEVIHEQSNRGVIWLVGIGLILWFASIEVKRRNPHAPVAPAVIVEPVEVSPSLGSEDDRWAALAVWVKSGKVEGTAELLSIARQLDLDTARLNPLIDKPARITDANKQRILDLIGGVE